MPARTQSHCSPCLVDTEYPGSPRGQSARPASCLIGRNGQAVGGDGLGQPAARTLLEVSGAESADWQGAQVGTKESRGGRLWAGGGQNLDKTARGASDHIWSFLVWLGRWKEAVSQVCSSWRLQGRGKWARASLKPLSVGETWDLLSTSSPGAGCKPGLRRGKAALCLQWWAGREGFQEEAVPQQGLKE